MTRVASFVILALALGATAAAAAPPGPPPVPDDWTFPPGSRIAVPTDLKHVAAAPEQISHIIWLNRCAGGCTYTKSNQNDALTNLTTIGNVAPGTPMTLSAWALTETTWNAYVNCMRTVYGPYDVQVVTDDPGPVPHHEAVVA